jgi:hypothetical protein
LYNNIPVILWISLFLLWRKLVSKLTILITTSEINEAKHGSVENIIIVWKLAPCEEKGAGF